MQQKVYFVINSMAGGGAERVLSTIVANARHYADRYAIKLILLDDEHDAYTLPDWLAVHRLHGKGGLMASIRTLSAYVANERPDIMVSFLTRANICTVIAARRIHCASVISERIHTTTHLGNGLGGRVAKVLVRWFYPRADRVLCVSEGVGDDLAANFGVHRNNIQVIYNPFDLERISLLSDEPAHRPTPRPYAVAMGRLVDAKNFDFLIRAYHDAGGNHDLVIAGEGPRREQLMTLIAQMGLEARVHLPGFAANPYALMKGADFYILSSNTEGFPNGLVEAMAVGLPVIATDCPSGPSEILEGHATAGEVVEAPHGLLVPCGDIPAMAKALKKVTEPETIRRYILRSQMRVKDFAVGPTVERYWDAIVDVLRTHTK